MQSRDAMSQKKVRQKMASLDECASSKACAVGASRIYADYLGGGGRDVIASHDEAASEILGR